MLETSVVGARKSTDRRSLQATLQIRVRPAESTKMTDRAHLPVSPSLGPSVRLSEQIDGRTSDRKDARPTDGRTMGKLAAMLKKITDKQTGGPNSLARW